MFDTKDFSEFCEENKINIENNDLSRLRTLNDKINVGCFTCSVYFECQVQYIFSSKTQNTEPKCKKCRRKNPTCEHKDCKTQPYYN